MGETEALLRLQEIDLTLMRHKKTLSAMPQMQKVKAAQTARKKLASQMRQIVGERKDAEMDLEENESRQLRLHEIVEETQAKFESGETGYRDLKNLEEQLTSLAKRIEKYEFQHKELLSRLERARKAEANARALDDKLCAEGEALVESLREQTADIERDVRILSLERETVLASITPEVRARYDASVKRFGGLAVERLRGNVPSVCRVTVPPSVFGDIKRGPAIAECPYCHRMLVTDGMFAEKEKEDCCQKR